MNILLLENDSTKAQLIIQQLQRFNHDVTSLFCTDDVKNALKSTKYDALIVDLKVPKQNGKPDDVSYGFKLIQYIFDGVRETIFRPKIVIVLSRYLSDEVRENLQSYPVSIIPYESMETWKKTLISRLNYYDKLRYDIAIITAVDVEFKAVKDWGWHTENKIPGFTYYAKDIKNYEGKNLKIVLVKLSEMGMVCATSTTDRIIHYFEPKCIIMVGICAGRKGATNLGDIVVASTAWDYGSGSIEEDKNSKRSKKILFNPAPNYISLSMKHVNVFDWYTSENINILKESMLKDAMVKSDGKLIDVISNEQKRTTILHQGAMATGAAVIKAEPFVIKFVKEQNRKYFGLDMETYGVYYAAKHGGVREFFAVKSISDLADTEKDDTYQKYCAKLSAAFILHFITCKYTA